MKFVKIYSLENCQYCERAKALLRRRGIDFDEVKVDRNDSATIQELVQRTRMRTFPQIFLGEQLIGGYSELEKMERNAKLDSLLQDAVNKKTSGCGCH